MSLTFPARLESLTQKFYLQAKSHPAFVHMSPTEIRTSIENRLWSVATRQPMWWGCQAKKREATPEQLLSLEKARQRKAEIRREVETPYEPDGEEAA